MAGGAHELVQSDGTLHETPQVPPVDVGEPVLPSPTLTPELLESSPKPLPPQATINQEAPRKDPISTRFFAIRMVDLTLSSPGIDVSPNPWRSAIETTNRRRLCIASG